MNEILPKVKVVTTVFNGEKFIKEEIDSILKQTYSNIELYIRDNCSTDGTLKVLQEYTQYPQVHIIKGDKNWGYTIGFFTVLDLCGDADYYAICDSDDVWPENKIESAIEMLKGTDDQVPILYCSAYDICDEDLNFIIKSAYKCNISFRNSMVDNVCTASTAVFNRKARNVLLEGLPNIKYHDFWMYMLCQGLGKVIYDPRSLMKYRRHNNNDTDMFLGKNKFRFMLWRVRRFLVEDDWWNTLKNQIQEYSNLYGDQLSTEDKKTLELFTTRNLVTTLKKVFYPKMFCQDIPHEIMQRGMFLLGKL